MVFFVGFKRKNAKRGSLAFFLSFSHIEEKILS